MIVLNKNSSKFHFIIQTNSPGELAAWVRPIVATCLHLEPDCSISICLVPCQYATGEEATVARSIEGVHQVLTPKETVLFLLGFGSLPIHAEQGAVLCLGGDPLYAQLLGFRLGFPSSIYTEHQKKPGLFFKHIFYKHRHGDLMQACVSQYQLKASCKHDILDRYQLPDRPYVLFFLGSRSNHFLAFSDLIVPMINYFLSLQDTIDIIIPIAPTISARDVAAVNNADLGDRVHIVRGNSLDFMSIAICMMSLPGTNTAEAMYMGLPMVTVVPLNRLDLLSLDGLLGLLGSIPLLGAWLKRLLVPLLLKKVAFVSLPNRVAQKSIVPEWIGMIDPKTLADDFYQFVSNQAALDAIRRDLAKIACQPDVDTLIIKQIFDD